VLAPPRPRHGCGALLRWGGADAGGGRRGRQGGWEGACSNICPRILRFPCPLRAHCESRDAICRTGSRRHSVESGHAPADRSATWLRFRGGSIGLPITLQRATAVCVWTVRAPCPSSSRVAVLAGLRDRQRQARCAVAASSCRLPAPAVGRWVWGSCDRSMADTTHEVRGVGVCGCSSVPRARGHRATSLATTRFPGVHAVVRLGGWGARPLPKRTALLRERASGAGGRHAMPACDGVASHRPRGVWGWRDAAPTLLLCPP
jgi:hypothetical protein